MGELLYLPLQARRQQVENKRARDQEAAEEGREVSKQEEGKEGGAWDKQKKKRSCFLFSNCLILCWNENLYNLEACCF